MPRKIYRKYGQNTSKKCMFSTINLKIIKISEKYDIKFSLKMYRQLNLYVPKNFSFLKLVFFHDFINKYDINFKILKINFLT